MRVSTASFAPILLLALVAPAFAQSPGPITGARVIEPEARLAGAYLLTSDHSFGALAQLRLSYYPGVDFGFQGGLVNLEEGSTDRTLVRVGADVRAALARASTTGFDLTAGAGLGIDSGDDVNALSFGPFVTAGVELLAGDRARVSPFATVGLALSRLNAGDRDESDVSLPIRLGFEATLGQTARLLAEARLNFNDSIRDDFELVLGGSTTF